MVSSGVGVVVVIAGADADAGVAVVAAVGGGWGRAGPAPSVASSLLMSVWFASGLSVDSDPSRSRLCAGSNPSHADVNLQQHSGGRRKGHDRAQLHLHDGAKHKEEHHCAPKPNHVSHRKLPRLTALCIRKIDAICSCFAGLGFVPPLLAEHRAQIVSVRSRRQPDARREPR
ncbi:hypothetical protein ACQJBY_063597 [Aegilops geniculata]